MSVLIFRMLFLFLFFFSELVYHYDVNIRKKFIYIFIVLVAIILQMNKTTIAFVAAYNNNLKIIKSTVENLK